MIAFVSWSRKKGRCKTLARRAGLTVKDDEPAVSAARLPVVAETNVVAVGAGGPAALRQVRLVAAEAGEPRLHAGQLHTRRDRGLHQQKALGGGSREKPSTGFSDSDNRADAMAYLTQTAYASRQIVHNVGQAKVKEQRVRFADTKRGSRFGKSDTCFWTRGSFRHLESKQTLAEDSLHCCVRNVVRIKITAGNSESYIGAIQAGSDLVHRQKESSSPQCCQFLPPPPSLPLLFAIGLK